MEAVDQGGQLAEPPPVNQSQAVAYQAIPGTDQPVDPTVLASPGMTVPQYNPAREIIQNYLSNPVQRSAPPAPSSQQIAQSFSRSMAGGYSTPNYRPPMFNRDDFLGLSPEQAVHVVNSAAALAEMPLDQEYKRALIDYHRAQADGQLDKMQLAYDKLNDAREKMQLDTAYRAQALDIRQQMADMARERDNARTETQRTIAQAQLDAKAAQLQYLYEKMQGGAGGTPLPGSVEYNRILEGFDKEKDAILRPWAKKSELTGLWSVDLEALNSDLADPKSPRHEAAVAAKRDYDMKDSQHRQFMGLPMRPGKYREEGTGKYYKVDNSGNKTYITEEEARSAR